MMSSSGSRFSHGKSMTGNRAQGGSEYFQQFRAIFFANSSPVSGVFFCTPVDVRHLFSSHRMQKNKVFIGALGISLNFVN